MSQPPTLLTLPPEIRRKILHYAIYTPRLAPAIPNAIIVSKLRGLKGLDGRKIPSDKRKKFYGTDIMSSIFVVCRLIHAELEEVLFTRFIFSFPHYMRLATVQEFTTTISPRACTGSLDIFEEKAAGVEEGAFGSWVCGSTARWCVGKEETRWVCGYDYGVCNQFCVGD
ncbi:hypothetical protein OCU04_005859 [Sclerotinia nivalis]|uniref:F-box domain-containing protein n=1 Tax=Sclerotinia nivalis TaxID=352851 RepID=A0A9X0DKN8_9HELO|nr:hypothetical protein OCU04_005859 [Sclerotinia nivalis]